MSAKGNKAKANKNAPNPKDPTPKRAASAGRLPFRSPIDDGMRSQMYNLSPALQYRRRSGSTLVPGLQDLPPKKRRPKVSSDNTSASAADKSSSAEGTTISTSAVVKTSSATDKSSSADGTTISTSAVVKSSSAKDSVVSASAADKSSSAEGTPVLPLGIRLSDAVDKRLQQLSSNKTPVKEHPAMEGVNCPGNESGNTPLSTAEEIKASSAKGKAQGSRACSPWGDAEDLEEEDTKSSDPPKIAGGNHFPQLCTLRAHWLTIELD
jgi:hypothetical protein